MSRPARAAVCLLLFSLVATGAAAQARAGDLRVSLVYTGRSLGALGVLRAQEEHELITEQANAEQLPFKLVSHACWRAPGITIFLPTDEPEGDELPALLAARGTAQRIDSVPAIRSNNVLLVQDPRRPTPDILALLSRNPRKESSFPDMVPTRVTVYRLRAPKGERAYVIQEEGAEWPDDPSAWTVGEMNRVNIEDARLFELPVNLGEIGSRAAVLKRVVTEARAASAGMVIADLGERDGDLGLERQERARIDYTALTRLGYSLAVPYEFELALGAHGIRTLREEFPGMRLLASNVKAKDTTLFEPGRLVEVAGVKIGLFGLVDPHIRGELPRQILDDFLITSATDAARREVRALRLAGAEAVVVLSNLESAENAEVAEQVAGIDAIVADLHVRWSPEEVRTEVTMPDRPHSRPGSPALVARGFANGLGVGRLDLVFRTGADGGRYLAAVSHVLESVTDRTPPDTALTREVREMVQMAKRPRGELMFPSFVELTNRHPELRDFDETTQQGRVSKEMWEEFVARVLRNNGRAEVAIIRKFPHFPPLIGKLHEDEVRSWLWAEDQVVVLDLSGQDLRKVLESDVRGELVASGVDRKKWLIMGRKIDDDVFYRVATTDVIYEGERAPDFEKARRVRRWLRLDGNAAVEPASKGETLSLRNLVLAELRHVRSLGKGDEYLDRIAQLVRPDPAFENLLIFAFDRPTLYSSLNRASGNSGYGSVPESRVTSSDAFVIGASGTFRVTYDRLRFASDLGLGLAYDRQSQTESDGTHRISESADDIKLGLTLRRKSVEHPRRLQPFVRGLFDTEFTPTVNPVTDVTNPRQLAVSGVFGLMRQRDRKWRVLEVGAMVENDFGINHLQVGVMGRTDTRWPLGQHGRVIYALRNDASYFLPSKNDTESDLALRYNMVHELLIPLVDELSLSVAADFFFYKGKVEATSTPGVSMLLRVGLTYDRLWKPRYQPLF